MRSNDLILGFPYDAASFTLLQEKMLVELREFYSKLKMGYYYHVASSMHLYQKHYDMVEKILKLTTAAANVKLEMPKINDLSEIKKLQYNEKNIREGKKIKLKLLKDKFCLWCQDILINHDRIKEYARNNN